MTPLARPRPLHPAAWWGWATALAIAASRTTNPVLLALLVAVTAYVAAARRPATPWSRSYVVFLRIGLLAVAIRVVLFALLGGNPHGHVLVTLPEVPLPHWLAGLRLGGPISLDGVLAASYDGLRLAVILVCVGAANTLTSPRRLLKSLPSAVQEAGVAVTVALAFAPQAVTSVARLRDRPAAARPPRHRRPQPARARRAGARGRARPIGGPGRRDGGTRVRSARVHAAQRSGGPPPGWSSAVASPCSRAATRWSTPRRRRRSACPCSRPVPL